jgi:hypothetical protein
MIHHETTSDGPARDLHLILRTCMAIYDVAITLLGDPPAGGVVMPGPAHLACMKGLLRLLRIGEEKETFSW